MIDPRCIYEVEGYVDEELNGTPKLDEAMATEEKARAFLKLADSCLVSANSIVGCPTCDVMFFNVDFKYPPR